MIMTVGGFLLLVVSGCSVPGFGPDADPVVEELAEALAAGSVEGVAFVGDDASAVEQHRVLTEGLQQNGAADLGSPSVTVADVSTDGDSGRASLEWRWSVGADTWTYDTEVALAKGDEADWLVRWSPQIVEPSLAEGERLASSTVKPERGEILGAGDKPIVTQRPVLRLGIDKTDVGSGGASDAARALAGLLDIAPRDYVPQVEAAGPKAFVQAIVFRRDEVPAGVLDGLASVPGGRAISDELPLAPSKDFAGAILGSVGPATAELVEDSDGRIKPGDDVGLSGLQKRYDEQLSGTRGLVVVAVDEEDERRRLFAADAVAGTPLRTTIDLEAQGAAQRALAGVRSASALVALRPSTGDLVAVASGPGSEGYNTATFGRYAPGSTFKVVSTLALLRAGASPQAKVSCPATTVVDGKTFKNYDDYPAGGLGEITLADAVANSCNTAFITEREKLEPDALDGAAAALGLGVDHDLGFPAFFGEVGKAGSETGAAAAMIGQGSVLASPMAMATVLASVLEGSAVLPRLLPEVEVKRTEPAAPLTAAESRQLTTMLRGVVERGSGQVLGDLPGQPAIAKTGTAEFGTSEPLPTHAWMVGGRGDLAVAVFVERGESGSGTAGPILRRFLAEVR